MIKPDDANSVVIILDHDKGHATIEHGCLSFQDLKSVGESFGQGSPLNCGRPRKLRRELPVLNNVAVSNGQSADDSLWVYRIYHGSVVDGPGRRSVVQVSGCSIRCDGCYVPETHERQNGRRTSVMAVVQEIDENRASHDGVTILGGEPFDQIEALLRLTSVLKENGHHIVVYTGFELDQLRDLESSSGNDMVSRVLANVDLLIDGPFKKVVSTRAGEYRGSINQRIIPQPVLF